MKSQYQIDPAEVVELLRKQGRMMTYVVRNWLADGRPGLKTYQVRRMLERLERQGIVERSNDHPYVTQIGWRLPSAPGVTQ